MAGLIPSHVQKVFARVYHESRTIAPRQLVVESHAGHGEGAEVELSAASAAVARIPPLHRRRWRRRRCCQRQRRARQHGSKSVGSSAKWECYRCGQRGHFARTHGAIPSGIRWGAGAFFGSATAAPSAQGQKSGSSRCWKGGIFRGWRIFAVHFCSAAAAAARHKSHKRKTVFDPRVAV